MITANAAILPRFTTCTAAAALMVATMTPPSQCPAVPRRPSYEPGGLHALCTGTPIQPRVSSGSHSVQTEFSQNTTAAPYPGLSLAANLWISDLGEHDGGDLAPVIGLFSMRFAPIAEEERFVGVCADRKVFGGGKAQAGEAVAAEAG